MDVFDSTPWTRIVDDVAVFDGGTTDVTYSATVLDAGFDGGSFAPGGASRIPNATDTNTTADWLRNDFDGFGFPGFPGTPELGEAINTPDAVNAAVAIPTDPIGACNDPATMIHDIQGSGLSSPDVGSIRSASHISRKLKLISTGATSLQLIAGILRLRASSAAGSGRPFLLGAAARPVRAGSKRSKKRVARATRPSAAPIHRSLTGTIPSDQAIPSQGNSLSVSCEAPGTNPTKPIARPNSASG